MAEHRRIVFIQVLGGEEDVRRVVDLLWNLPQDDYFFVVLPEVKFLTKEGVEALLKSL